MDWNVEQPTMQDELEQRRCPKAHGDRWVTPGWTAGEHEQLVNTPTQCHTREWGDQTKNQGAVHTSSLPVASRRGCCIQTHGWDRVGKVALGVCSVTALYREINQ